MATYLLPLQIIDGRLRTSSTNFDHHRVVVEIAPGYLASFPSLPHFTFRVMTLLILVGVTTTQTGTAGLTALDEKPAVWPSTTANMTTPNQLMELSHPQSHDDASTLNASLTMTVKLAALSRGVVPAGTDECARDNVFHREHQLEEQHTEQEPADSHYADVGTLPVKLKPPTHNSRIQYSDVRPRKTLPVGEEPTNPPSTKTHLLTDVTPTATSDILKTLPSGATFVLREEPTPPSLAAKACPIRPLILETLIVVLHPTVTPKWQKVGELLGLDEDLLDEILTNKETDGECLKGMLGVWLQKSMNPTWKDVTDALSECGEDQLAEYLYLKYILPGMIAVPPAPTSSERMPPPGSSEVAGDRQEPAFIEIPLLEEAEEICADRPGVEILHQSYTGYFEDTMQEREDQIELIVSAGIVAPFDHKPRVQDYKPHSWSVLQSSKAFVARAGDSSHCDEVIVPPEATSQDDIIAASDHLGSESAMIKAKQMCSTSNDDRDCKDKGLL